MCVIMLVEEEGKRPTDDMINRAWNWNDDFGGVAWREPHGPDGDIEVFWKKGIQSLEEMRRLIKTLPMPFVAHFRRASCGGINPELNHPFPVSKNPSPALEGRTKGDVLFHNGDWKEWDHWCLETAIRKDVTIPDGEWSDSRAIAWLCGIYGNGLFKFIPTQKGVIYGPDTLELLEGKDGWTNIQGIWCSNTVFMEKQKTTSTGTVSSTYCRFPTCTRKDKDAEGYCPIHKSGIFRPEVADAMRKAQLEMTNKLAPPVITVVAPLTGPIGVVETGGSQLPIPFLSLQMGDVISLAMAERLHNQVGPDGKRMVSKNCLKKLKELYSRWGNGKVKDSAKAWQHLRDLSRKLTFSGPVV